MKVVLFNAPPSSGKSWACNYLVSKFEGKIATMSFKDKLETIIKELYFIDDCLLDHYKKEENKDCPSFRFDWKSYREALIFVAEEVIKPKMGKDFFAEAAMRSSLDLFAENDDIQLVVFDDLGFQEELDIMVESYGKDNVYVIRIGSKYNLTSDKPFENDSRTFVDCSVLPPNNIINMYNKKDNMFAKDLETIISNIL